MPTDVEELSKLVTNAERAIAGLEDMDLRRVAFERVLDHLLGNGAGHAPDGNVGDTLRRTAQTEYPPVDDTFADEQQRIYAISTYFGITREQAEDLFDATGEAPALKLSTEDLSGTMAEATREITLLVGGARTALGQATHTDHIRSQVDNYGKLDTINFMSTLNNMPEINLRGKRSSSNRLLRMKVPGAEKARRLAQRLVGE